MKMRNSQNSLKLHLALGSLAFLLAVAAVGCDRQGSARRISGSGASKGFQSPCGTAEQVSQKVGGCLEPIFALIEGRYGGEPKSDEDLIGHCDKFAECEKCIRNIAKDCLTGIHKTSTSSVASATKRFRTAECKSPQTRAKFSDPLKCSIKQAKDMSQLYRNHTGILQTIRDLPNTTAEEKLVKMCCVLNAVDVAIERQFNSVCPKSTPVVLMIVHAMTDDARNTLCINPKCNNVLEPLIARSHYKPPQNFIEPIAEILYQLNVN